tara:strand:+ start:2670 stop:3557 length:888 start_codon:yes stop_codon:yes gene_type:complete
MKVLLTGSTGQLGKSIIKMKSKYIDLISTNREQLDLSNTLSCEDFVLTEKPDWVINCAAFTAVDQAEKDIDLSRKINSFAPEAFANAVNKINGRLLHISTDFVFDGQQNFPYKTNQKTNPINQYGYSKALGEELIMKKTKSKKTSIILRTSWVTSPYGKNFILTMLKLHEQRKSINVVCDQIGAPTSAKHLAKICWKIIHFKKNKELPEILHWSDAGVASWYDLAVAVGDIGIELGIIKKKAFVNPIKTENYPLPAKRPKYSILDSQSTCDTLDVMPNHWRINLLETLKEYKRIK